MDRFASMTAFVKVVECGSFSAAARRLNLSPNRITKHVQSLEERLGVRLLNRTTRKVSLTEVGRVYYERCTRLLGELDETERLASALQTTPRGELRVNAAPSFGMLQLAPAIQDFTTLYPDVSVELNLTERMVDLVEEGLDVAVRVEALPDSSLIARHLAPCRVVICAAPSYLERHGVPQTPADLAAHNCLTLTMSPFYSEWHFIGADGKEQKIHVTGNLRANSAIALAEAALKGQGLTFQPTYVVGEDLNAGRLVPVLSDYALAELAVRALYPHSRLLSAKVRAFVDFLVARFGQEPAWDAWRRRADNPLRQDRVAAAGDRRGLPAGAEANRFR
jgi:DNA-binding transcriptional LysR family regulator